MLHLIGRFVLAGVIVAVVIVLVARVTRRETPARSREEAAALLIEEPVPAPALPIIDGWTLAEVKSRHGEPASADKATGWARWPSFAAHFTSGIVDDVRTPAP